MEDLKDKVDIRHIKNKQQNGKNPFLSIITLNLNGFNFPIKKTEMGRMEKRNINQIYPIDSLQIQGQKEVESEGNKKESMKTETERKIEQIY